MIASPEPDMIQRPKRCAKHDLFYEKEEGCFKCAEEGLDIVGDREEPPRPPRHPQHPSERAKRKREVLAEVQAIAAGGPEAFIKELISQSDMEAPAAFDILRVCLELATFLISKNSNYGDSALNPVRVMSKADPVEQLRVRMDDKLSRLLRGQAGGEDTLKDLVGYWVLLKVAERRALNGGENVSGTRG